MRFSGQEPSIDASICFISRRERQSTTETNKSDCSIDVPRHIVSFVRHVGSALEQRCYRFLLSARTYRIYVYIHIAFVVNRLLIIDRGLLQKHHLPV